MDSLTSVLRFAVIISFPASLLAQEPAGSPQESAAAAVILGTPFQSGAIEALTEKVTPSIVAIWQIGRDGKNRGLGAGFVIDESGLVATNHHVIGEGRPVRVELSTGETRDVTEIYLSDPYFDLAVLRMAPGKAKLKALTLGDSDQLRQGQAVVGFGSPRGLKFSVVTGVISAIRKLEQQFLGDETPQYPMIQLAMPIEQGNSGGPIVNLDGEVVGITTLKHRLTENLGFAVRSNDLSQLLLKPNPIAMSRWKTIGALDPRQWAVLFDGDWNQRGGVIYSNRAGSGFGGRTLCLAQNQPSPGTYEVAVKVRLGDESGAAGLVFASDGGDRHFGFYPTDGKLRLTRFDGPTVYNWTILTQVQSGAYQPGQWNHLRVRVEGEAISCFVNGEEVISMKVPGIGDGRCGLCKFRDSAAEFRDFEVGDNLAEKTWTLEQAGEIEQTVTQFLSPAPGNTEELAAKLSAQGPLGMKYLDKKAEELENAARRVRKLKEQLHERAVVDGLKQAIENREAEIDLFEVALQLARIDDPELNINHYREVFGRLVSDAAVAIQGQKGKDAVMKLRDFLFKENGFHGSRNEYYHPANSYISHVLDDREGLPITLSVLFIEMARRLKIDGVHGVSLPGQFLVGFRQKPEDELLLINVFDQGKTISRGDAEALALSFGAVTSDATFQPSAPRSIAVRMLENLISLALDQDKNPPGALGYLNLLLAIDADNSAARFQRALVRVQVKELETAKQDLDWLLTKRPPGINYPRLQQFRDSLP